MKSKLIGFIAALSVLPAIAGANYYGWPTSWDFASLKISGAAVESAADSHSYADTGDASTLTSAQGYADTVSATAETNAKSYADTVSATAETNAKAYADAGDALKASLNGANFSGSVQLTSTQPQLQINESDTNVSVMARIGDGRLYFAPYEESEGGWLWDREFGYSSTSDKWFFDTALNVQGYPVWTSGNDGAGSGLDADYIDGRSTATIWGSDNDGAGSGLDAGQVAGMGVHSYSASCDFPSIAAGASASCTLAVDNSIAIGSPCFMGMQYPPGLSYMCNVIEGGDPNYDTEVTIYAHNHTSGAINPITATFNAVVFD